MSKERTVFRCTECGASAPKWAGRCAACSSWNTLVEERESSGGAGPGGIGGSGGRVAAIAPIESARPIDAIDAEGGTAQPTGVEELDRVLGGGLVPGSVTLLGGEPGIGKSTLLLQLLASTAGRGARCLLLSGEESPQQVRLRASRLGALHPQLLMASETSLPTVLGHIDEVQPTHLVIDSIQTVADPALSSAPGSVTQVRECAHALVQVAKSRSITTILVGHVTKEGALAGPRVLEHIVDTVLSFEGDRHHALRLLRATKHRFGATGELGVFEMREDGLAGVADPSAMFLGDRQAGVAGSVVVPAMEGQRPLLVEVQALVSPTQNPMPRRSAQGLDGSRLALIVAVVQQRAGVGLGTYEVFASAVGGVSVGEPAVDLGMALALVSSRNDVPIPSDLVAFGEIGLAGEVRQVAHMGRRLAEAARVGFRQALVAASAPDPPRDVRIRLIRVPTLRAAIRTLGLDG